MRQKTTIILLPLLVLSILLSAQVKTKFSNNELIGNKGRFDKGYKEQINFEISPKNINELIEKEKKEKEESKFEKPFQLAEPEAIDLDIAIRNRFIKNSYN